MNNETIVLAIDIGNTRTHTAVVDIGKLRCIDKVIFNNTEFNERFTDSVKKLCSSYHIRKINISSCVKGLAVQALQICKNIGIDKIDTVKADGALGLTFKYENLNGLGSDRVCNALACAALFKGENCVIISCGTAVTIDYIAGGKTFDGGVIFAGSAAHLTALHKQTDALPHVIIDDSASFPFPAQSTEKCIAAGVIYATAGAIDRCTEEYARVYGDDIRLIATGGGWEFIKPFVKRSDRITTVPDLTLIGAGVYQQKDCGSSPQ